MLDEAKKRQGGSKMADLWLAGIIAGILLVYLVYALLKPEDF
jgi:K+-transporting ATPase KdpF subunit